MKSLRFALGTLAVALLLLPAGASAQSTNAPPGNSAIDEYLETVPSSSGNRPPRGPDRNAVAPDRHAAARDRDAGVPARKASGPAPEASGPILTPSQHAALERHGSEGEELAALVESGARRSHQPDPLPEADGRPPLAKMVQTTLGDSDDGGGLGILLPLILSSALLATVAVVLVRRRSGSRPHP